jgi:2-(1,2-epoxy-1,2-dihydrophenyl)acetyl-CoA isomerase
MQPASDHPVTTTLDEATGVALVEFSRPPLNFFDTALITAIGDAYGELEEDPRCRAIVLASPGKHFCAGADFSGGRLTDDQTRVLYQQAARLFSYSVPVIAAVQGRAVGGGLGVAMSADFRVAAPASRFVCNFARLNIHHGFGLTVTLPAVLGQQRALELLYTGGDVDGERALALGLCDRLATTRDVREEATAFAEEIAAAGPLAVRAIRRTMWAQRYPALIEAATALEHREQSWLFDTEDFREGVTALSERRAPQFKAR